jgi:hypothetical protein
MIINRPLRASRSSRSCSLLPPAEIAPAQRRDGLDGFCLTDHDQGWSEPGLVELRRAAGVGPGHLGPPAGRMCPMAEKLLLTRGENF